MTYPPIWRRFQPARAAKSFHLRSDIKPPSKPYTIAILTGRKNMNQFTEGQDITIYVTNIIDGQGQPATLVEPVEWTSSDESILSLTPSDDGLSASGTASSSGAVMITASSGDVKDSIALTVGAGDVVSFKLVAQPSDWPAPPPYTPPDPPPDVVGGPPMVNPLKGGKPPVK